MYKYFNDYTLLIIDRRHHGSMLHCPYCVFILKHLSVFSPEV